MFTKIINIVKTVGPLFSPKTLIFKIAAILAITSDKKK